MHTLRQEWRLIALYILVGLFFSLAPLYFPEYALIVLISILIVSIFVASLNIVSGYLGMITLGHAMFWGIGGYVVALLTTRGIVENFFMVLLIGLVVTGLLGAIVGIIVMRMTQAYFIIITFALGQVIYSVFAFSLSRITGGTDGFAGINRPNLGFHWTVASNDSFYYLVLIITAICFLFMYTIRRSPFGNAVVGIRDNESRMLAMGYNTFIYKYTTFIISGVMAGLGGMISVYFDRFISPSELTFAWSGGGLIMLFIGGIGTFWGALVGSTIYTLLRYIISAYTMYWSMISGGIFILVVLFFRGGVVVYTSRLLRGFGLGSNKS